MGFGARQNGVDKEPGLANSWPKGKKDKRKSNLDDSTTIRVEPFFFYFFTLFFIFILLERTIMMVPKNLKNNYEIMKKTKNRTLLVINEV